jgi:hypothetical protein
VEDLPLAPLALGAAALLVGPVRRRVLPVARATGAAALGLVGAAAGGIGQIVDAAVRGDRPDRSDRPGRSA